jgi:hypothetical protein
VRPHPRDRAGRTGRVVPLRPNAKPLSVRDLDGDGEPEIVLDLFWAGSRCCLWTRIYRFDRVDRRYLVSTHFWGNFQDSYRLRDLDQDGRPEFVAADGRFATISSTYDSADPVEIWSYGRHGLHDVTRGFSRAIAADASRWWALYVTQRGRRHGWVREPLAAWVADQYLLGHRERGERVLARALHRGELDLPRSSFAPSSRVYVRRLRAFLRTAGYSAK